MRKSKRARKLTLHRETLHRLSPDQLAAAQGGAPATENTTETCPHSGCFVCDPFPKIEA